MVTYVVYSLELCGFTFEIKLYFTTTLYILNTLIMVRHFPRVIENFKVGSYIAGFKSPTGTVVSALAL